MSHEIGITKVADHEVIGFCFAETWEFEIGTSNPEAFPLEPPDKVVTNEATGPTNQGKSSSHWFCQHFTGSELIVKSPDF